MEDTIKYYSVDPAKRRCETNEKCLYSPKKSRNPDTSAGCAIGRHLTPEAQVYFDNLPNIGIAAILSVEYGTEEQVNARKEMLPEWMRDMNVNFLRQI